MSLSHKLMVWDPDIIGCRDDSFKGGGWDPIGYDCDVDQIDGDYVELTVRAGKLTGYIEKWGINFDLAVYPYLVLGLWGDDDYWVQIWDGVAWLNAVLATASPATYDFRVHYLGGLAPAGNITALRIGVGSAAGKVCTYDFFEFHKRVPWFPLDMSKGRTLQKELEADYFELQVVECNIVDAETVVLLEMDENLGPKAFDDSGNENDGVITGADWDTGGTFDNCLKFVRANNDIVTISDADELSIDETGEMTWDFYFKLSSDGILQYIFGKGAAAKWEYIMRVNLDNTITFIVYQLGGAVHLTATSINAVVNGRWYHAIVTAKENDSLYVYIDRVLWASDLVSSGAIGNEDQDLILGRQASVAANYLDAYLDVFRVVNRVYTPIERRRAFDCSNVCAKRVYVAGRNIRIVLGRGTNVDKIFAGMIEESIPKSGLRDVTGRCFQQKIQELSYSEDHEEDAIKDVVAAVVSDLTEVTLGRVATPFPAINVTKYYSLNYVSEILDQLASIPSKQAPLNEWRWKLGYGQDLRFREIDHANVRACDTTITEGTNLLANIKKGSDVYEIANKVQVLGGDVLQPFDITELTNALVDWAITWCALCTAPVLAQAVSGKYTYIQISDNTLNWFRIENDPIPTILDLRKVTKIRVVLRVSGTWAGGGTFPGPVDFRFGQNNANCYQMSFNVPNSLIFKEYEFDLSECAIVGAPTLNNVDWIGAEGVWPVNLFGNFRIANVQFICEDYYDEAIDGSSVVSHDRVFVYKDSSLINLVDVENLADGLLEYLKLLSQRIVLPVTGEPDLQRGRKVTVDSPSLQMDDDYIIAEAEHQFGRGVGYVVYATLNQKNFNIAMDIAKYLQKRIRLEELGGVRVVP